MEQQEKFYAKIVVYMVNEENVIDKVVYYRGNLSMQLIEKYSWYFRYLAARLQVGSPKLHVGILIGRQRVIIGKDFHEDKRQSLLLAARRKLKGLEVQKVTPDLFGWEEETRKERISKQKEKIKALESDEWPIPEFPEYINNTKEYPL